ncbi:MAG TPA: NADH-quinone oxidoreductase subunit C [Armatimonadota bacterium]|jgi:NADH-quinone oxidoreductase subunit C|nr:NADH-quinone oxidoreductase subunit C [Armatimonadota bacterium]HOJ22740.1 NADH-quinone oxidoreductase subunit C [Armatimonadota bacterium]HOM83797.1 NADH-quinone oxidoreductase subunit C [Armatimonadota bacterium]HPO73082.1 NADH-quinone oxidoreductase subunit C [Armatimonadota bacterium]HPT96812.1 NADH-quinone oxidoreductase subunit C [Armatimonadota bacterium]
MADEKKIARPASDEAADPFSEVRRGLQQRFGEDVAVTLAPGGDLVVTVGRERLLAVCRYLKEEQGFDYPILVTGVDRGDGLESVIHLGQMTSPRVIVLKTPVSYDDPQVPSVTSIWAGADWHERESYDLMGIRYEGHPDLRRILLPEEWDEYPHPLRKEFKLDSPGGKFSITE